MNATELRIGNWVLVPTGGEIPIPAYPKKVKAITLFGEFDFTEPQYPEPHIVAAKHCAGIPLTEEILLKAGFVKGTEVNGDEYFKFNPDQFHAFILWPYTDSTFGFNWDEDDNTTKIQFVHQLQNLYFALAGEELEVKL